MKELIKKIELQSIVVLAITLFAGCFLLNKDNSFVTPAGILGAISIIVGLIYTFISFMSNQIRESYKDVIAEYQNTILTLRSSHRDIEKSYQDTLVAQSGNSNSRQYTPISNFDPGTKDG